MEDPREQLSLQRHPGARQWLDSAYARDYEVGDLEAERRRWTEEIPLHLQFNYALIYEWWKGLPDPRVTDAKVRDALDRAAGAIRRATSTPDASRCFAITRDEIWPIYQELLDEAYDREQRKQNETGQGQGQPRGQGQASQGVKDKMEKMEREQRDKHASKMIDKQEKMEESQREKAKQEMKALARNTRSPARVSRAKGERRSRRGRRGKGWRSKRAEGGIFRAEGQAARGSKAR